MCISAQMISYISGYEVTGRTSSVYTCVELFGDENCKINTIPGALSAKPFIYLSNIFIPVDDILPRLGFSMWWDDSLKAIVCAKDGVTSYIIMNRTNMWVGNTNYEFDLPPMIKGGVTYISAAMLGRLAGCDIKVSGIISEYRKRDTLKNTYATDAYRLKGTSVAAGGGVTAVDGFGMELVGAKCAELCGCNKFGGGKNSECECVQHCCSDSCGILCTEKYVPESAGRHENALRRFERQGNARERVRFAEKSCRRKDIFRYRPPLDAEGRILCVQGIYRLCGRKYRTARKLYECTVIQICGLACRICKRNCR